MPPTLENYIFSSIFHYPSLNYKETFEESSNTVLDHIFLCVGNGLHYKNKNNKEGCGYFGPVGKKISKEYKQRILNNEPIVEILNISKRHHRTSGRIFELIGNHVSGEFDYNEKYLFYSDFELIKHKYIETGTKYTNLDELDKYEGCFSVYPKDNIERQKRLERLNKIHSYSPSYFSLEYTVFYDREQKAFIPKNMIAKDWLEGIVSTYTRALNWYRNDELFFSNPYHNWILEKQSVKSFTEKFTSIDDKFQLCSDYNIARKNYYNPEDMIKDIITQRRIENINDCNKVIDFYS